MKSRWTYSAGICLETIGFVANVVP